MRFTIEEYAKAYSISTEMVHSRLRRNRLNYIMEDDTTYIVVPKHQVPYDTQNEESKESPQDTNPSPVVEKKTTVATVIGLYQKENHYLKLKIQELEAKVDRLIDEKEQLLKEERIRIEKVYTDKDAQLKSILELVNTKLLQDANAQSHPNPQAHIEPLIVEETSIQNKSVPLETKEASPVELKQYLRSLNIKASARKAIKRRFAEAFGADSRILLKNGLFYLDFDRYDYSDLLKYK